VEGLNYKSGKVFSVQFHPEACAGPQDTGFLFDKFMDLMGGSRI
jgi:carbamoyl-phosphate synthase small subunit